MSTLDVPVVLFMFKRRDTTLKVLREIAAASPSMLYLIGDGPRDAEEAQRVRECREAVDAFVDTMDCDVVRNYADSNRGVFENIAGGARWVFEREDRAIFLEDDTIPDPTFFPFCEDMLTRYEKDDRVLWVCGTNYLGQSKAEDGSDYVFTQHMLPCGWASWASKFPRYYDGELDLFTSANVESIRSQYSSARLYAYDVGRVGGERQRRDQGQQFLSWDYQMAFSIRVYEKLGIAPTSNLILNVGDDPDSTHGGTSRFNTMTRRFCGIPTRPLAFPLNHPSEIAVDRRFEARTTKIVLPPQSRLRRWGVLAFKRVFAVPADVSTREALHQLRGRVVSLGGARRPRNG
ncbi:hypothetical protein [Oryzobacter telluris]|uniref:hypothetical protein n=1 Tax=Oryzobacter telluris TaxID=3149179 RepID=UPI00370D7B2C